MDSIIDFVLPIFLGLIILILVGLLGVGAYQGIKYLMRDVKIPTEPYQKCISSHQQMYMVMVGKVPVTQFRTVCDAYSEEYYTEWNNKTYKLVEVKNE